LPKLDQFFHRPVSSVYAVEHHSAEWGIFLPVAVFGETAFRDGANFSVCAHL
jgi:hypothetical protein